MSAETTHKPKASGYAETKPTATPAPQRDQPDPDAAGGEHAQVAASQKTDEEQDPKPDEPEPTPPGEHKREPIKDPDPADTKLHVQQA